VNPRTALLLLAAGLVACDKPAPPPAPKTPAKQSAAPAPAPPPRVELARIPPKSAWPFIEASATASAGDSFDPSSVTKRNYYIVFDASGSMEERKCSGNERKIEVAKRALLQFAQIVPADANLGVLVFDEQGIYQLIPIGPLDPATLRRALAKVSAGGKTPLAQSIRDAYRALTVRAKSQLGYGEYHLVVVTDGEATGEDPRGIVDRLIAESPVVVHTIGFCIGDKHSLNQPGRTIYHAADSPQQLQQGLAEVLAEAPSFHAARFK
jgi:Ca-activated chloride channel family protein